MPNIQTSSGLRIVLRLRWIRTVSSNCYIIVIVERFQDSVTTRGRGLMPKSTTLATLYAVPTWYTLLDSGLLPHTQRRPYHYRHVKVGSIIREFSYKSRKFVGR